MTEDGSGDWQEYRRLIVQTLGDLTSGVKALDGRVHALERHVWIAVGAILAMQLALTVYSVLK